MRRPKWQDLGRESKLWFGAPRPSPAFWSRLGVGCRLVFLCGSHMSALARLGDAIRGYYAPYRLHSNRHTHAQALAIRRPETPLQRHLSHPIRSRGGL
jgi:hypothetical protein